MNIHITTIIDKGMFVNCEPMDTILSIKQKIEDNKGFKISSQILIFQGKILNNDKTLNYYDISDGSTLHMSMQMNGGLISEDFLDVSTGLYKNIQVTSNGPDRCIIHQGINLSGICEYSKCKDKGLQVYCRIKGDHYDFIKEITKAKCPTCDSMFSTKNVGFYKCYFTFKGVKYLSEKGSESIEIKDNTENGKYKTFDEFSTNNAVKWIELKVTVDTRKTTNEKGLSL